MAESSSEAGYFQPNSAKADFAYWAKMSNWSEAEFSALLFETNPHFAKRMEHIDIHLARDFEQKYSSLLNLALRATAARQVGYPHTPGRWLAWAKEVQLPVPGELEAEILKWDGAGGRSLSSERARITKLEASLKVEEQKRNEVVEALQKNAREISESEKSETENLKDAAKSMGQVPTRERESMLKLIIGMAVKGYRFDPKAKRSDKVLEITSDLQTCGLELSDDTVRRYLREAAELLPPEENPSG